MTENKLTTPRALKSQQTKERIYQAGLTLLKQYGYQYITVNNICQLAEVSTGSFYHFFDSKDTLLANFFVEAYNQMPTKETEYDDPIEEIIDGLCYYSEFCQNQGLDFIRHFYNPFNKSMSVNISNNLNLPILSNTSDKIKKAIHQGILKEETDPIQLATDLCTIEKGIIFEWCTSEGSFIIRDKSYAILSTYVKSYLK